MLSALAWAYLWTGAGMGGMADMPGMHAAPAWPLVAAMWWVMMIAMMVPSAAPVILLYGRVHRQSPAAAGPAPTLWFLAGYLACWLAFSLAATALQLTLQAQDWLSATGMESRSAPLSAALLIGAGLYQLSPFKDSCLSRCRNPAQILSRHYRPGAAGALRLGITHGAICVGCCWLLMALLFVVGVMNLAWIAALTLLVAAEKLLPGGRWIARGSGLALLAWGAALLAA